MKGSEVRILPHPPTQIWYGVNNDDLPAAGRGPWFESKYAHQPSSTFGGLRLAYAIPVTMLFRIVPLILKSEGCPASLSEVGLPYNIYEIYLEFNRNCHRGSFSLENFRDSSVFRQELLGGKNIFRGVRRHVFFRKAGGDSIYNSFIYVYVRNNRQHFSRLNNNRKFRIVVYYK